MSTHKHFNLIAILAMVLAVVLTVLCVGGTSLGLIVTAHAMGYEDRIFDTDKVHTVDIVMDDWDGFLTTCQSEEYSVCSVVIDGESFSNVGIRGKGNTSLTNVASMDSDRYSFKLEFDQYESGKTYHGLDKLCLNNIIQDNTYMKDYLAYRMMAAFGVDAPLCSFVYITVNGEDWGLYLAVEGIEESFLQRNYGSDYGELYKPDSMSFGGGRGNGKDFNMEDFDFEDLDLSNLPQQNTDDTAQSEQDTSKENKDTTQKQQQDTVTSATPSAGSSDSSAQMPTMGQMPQQGEMPDMSQMPQQGEMPDMSQMPQQGEMPDMSQMPQQGEMPDMSQMPQQGEMPDMSQMPQQDGDTQQGDSAQQGEKGDMGEMPNKDNKGGGQGGMGSDDVKLKYIDDDPDSYANIFDNAKTAVSEADQNRLIASLKNLSNYEDLENTVDVDEVLRYFVVHNYLVNGDSYTGSMIHNYYLYEKNGQLSMIPWDYNLAFGTFQGNNASDAVNDAIDEVLTDRPMQAWIFSDDSYTQQYHALYQEFLQSVDIQSMIDETQALIAPYVEKDPTAFCTYEEFEAGVTALKSFCQLRSESVQGQLDGTIPSTDDAQSGSDALVETGELNLSDMGTMSNGGGGMGGKEMPNGMENGAGGDAAMQTPPEKPSGQQTAEST